MSASNRHRDTVDLLTTHVSVVLGWSFTHGCVTVVHILPKYKSHTHTHQLIDINNYFCVMYMDQIVLTQLTGKYLVLRYCPGTLKTKLTWCKCSLFACIFNYFKWGSHYQMAKRFGTRLYLHLALSDSDWIIQNGCWYTRCDHHLCVGVLCVRVKCFDSFCFSPASGNILNAWSLLMLPLSL